ncbi:hypothetical protein JQ587_21430 [Bradyrhizobium manausense]|nr:hypothetical protein [Bradyrhizobium manausense]
MGSTVSKSNSPTASSRSAPDYDYYLVHWADEVGQVLNGAAPKDIPIPQPTKLTLAISLKTAKMLGLSVPSTLLASADEVIE